MGKGENGKEDVTKRKKIQILHDAKTVIGEVRNHILYTGGKYFLKQQSLSPKDTRFFREKLEQLVPVLQEAQVLGDEDYSFFQKIMKEKIVFILRPLRDIPEFKELIAVIGHLLTRRSSGEMEGENQHGTIEMTNSTSSVVDVVREGVGKTLMSREQVGMSREGNPLEEGEKIKLIEGLQPLSKQLAYSLQQKQKEGMIKITIDLWRNPKGPPTSTVKIDLMHIQVSERMEDEYKGGKLHLEIYTSNTADTVEKTMEQIIQLLTNPKTTYSRVFIPEKM